MLSKYDVNNPTDRVFEYKIDMHIVGVYQKQFEQLNFLFITTNNLSILAQFRCNYTYTDIFSKTAKCMLRAAIMIKMSSVVDRFLVITSSRASSHVSDY